MSMCKHYAASLAFALALFGAFAVGSPSSGPSSGPTDGHTSLRFSESSASAPAPAPSPPAYAPPLPVLCTKDEVSWTCEDGCACDFDGDRCACPDNVFEEGMRVPEDELVRVKSERTPTLTAPTPTILPMPDPKTDPDSFFSCPLSTVSPADGAFSCPNPCDCKIDANYPPIKPGSYYCDCPTPMYQNICPDGSICSLGWSCAAKQDDKGKYSCYRTAPVKCPSTHIEPGRIVVVTDTCGAGQDCTSPEYGTCTDAADKQCFYDVHEEYSIPVDMCCDPTTWKATECTPAPSTQGAVYYPDNPPLTTKTANLRLTKTKPFII